MIKENIRIALQELKSQVRDVDLQKIADELYISRVTIYNYLNGKVNDYPLAIKLIDLIRKELIRQEQELEKLFHLTVKE